MSVNGKTAMKRSIKAVSALLSGVVLAALAGAAQARVYLGVTCTGAGPARCEGEACMTSGALADLGDATEPKTGRKFFLDYPCDLKPGEKVVFILNLHGAGSIGNWQRHYFPALDDKDKYRLVVATPTAATSPVRVPGQPGVRVWVADADDAYLQNIATEVIGAFGARNIKAFWLAGHSQGGITSDRLACTPFFAGKVDGFLSLSGGRLGGSRMNPRFGPPKADGSPPDPHPFAMNNTALPGCDVSFIYETGEHEITDLQTTSAWADKLGCGARLREPNVTDTRPGYVWDYQHQGSPIWGLTARPGTAEVWVYPGCRGGRLVADIERLDKGHTEGLEPRVTEKIVSLMVKAPGGKVARAAAAS
jgi:poly(3-hydroxybutyrate) depolymerase